MTNSFVTNTFCTQYKIAGVGVVFYTHPVLCCWRRPTGGPRSDAVRLWTELEDRTFSSLLQCWLTVPYSYSGP